MSRYGQSQGRVPRGRRNSIQRRCNLCQIKSLLWYVKILARARCSRSGSSCAAAKFIESESNRKGFPPSSRLPFHGALLWRAKPLRSNWRAQASTVSASISRLARPRSRASQLSVVLVLALNILIDSGRGPTAQPRSRVRKNASVAGDEIVARQVCDLCRADFRFIIWDHASPAQYRCLDRAEFVIDVNK